MKTQIIQLEPHDDVISARDKMGWGQTGRILLVWPERGRVLTRRLDLVLLQRHTKTMGSQLGLVTNDPDVRYHAGRLAIPVFKNLKQSQRASWRIRTARRTRRLIRARLPGRSYPDLRQLQEEIHPLPAKWLRQPITRLGFFTIGVLAFLSIAAVLIPAAEVTLQPIEEQQAITLTITADPKLETPNISGVVPLRSMIAIVEGRASIPTTGTTRLADQYARGFVIFTNLTDRAIQVPTGTVIRTIGSNPDRFETTQAGTVQAGIGLTLSLPVQALSPGGSGNLPPDQLIAIEGALGLNLSATNPLPTRGGSESVVPAPNERDRRQLFTQLEKDLQQTALDEIQSQLLPGDILFLNSLRRNNILESRYDPEESSPADHLFLDLQLEYEAFRVSDKDLRQLFSALLDANLPEGFQPQASDLKIENLSEPVYIDGSKPNWEIRASRGIAAQIPETRVVQLSMGLSPNNAVEQLQSALPVAGSPGVVLKPAWWPRMPLLPFRIQVITQP